MRSTPGVLSNTSDIFWHGGSVSIFVETVAQLLLSLWAMLVNILCIQILWRPQPGLDFNVKVLLINCSATYFYRSFHYGLMCAYHLWILYVGDTSLSSLICIIIQYPYFVANLNSYVYFFLIGLERMWSTYRIKLKSDQPKVRPTSYFVKRSILLCFPPILILTIVYPFFCRWTVLKTSTLDYCIIGKIFNEFGYKFSNTLILIIQVLTCVVHGAVYFVNRWKYENLFANTALYKLTLRLQYSANLKITRWLTPISVFHCIWSFGTFFSMNFLRWFLPDVFKRAYFQAGRILFVCMAFECLTHPIMLIWWGDRKVYCFKKFCSVDHDFNLHNEKL
uniref:G-protein coupled receptors family 1 profile domain-containing protein n=1 Tax=Romanomermis culicivorax TaxID=13658 RepID=A0A915J2A1_ROMCU